MTAPDLVGVLSDAMPVLGDKLEAADRLAGGYARRYAEFYLGPKSTSRYPYAPRELDPNIAKLVREEVQEAALVRRSGVAA
jgi:hypothetical protein